MHKLLSFINTTVLYTLLSAAFASYSCMANDNNTPLRIAVSSNFSPVLAKIIPIFNSESGIKTEIISGSSGTLYQQILHGAPYDLFLSADDIHPQKLKQKSLIVPNSLTTYADGQLAFWSAIEPIFENNVDNEQLLKTTLSSYLDKSFRIAIANPNTAPYGQRAFEVLSALNLWQSFQQKLIVGINVNQTFQQIRSQAVTGGFVALSQLKINNLEGLTIPTNLYSPIKQQLVILKKSQQIAQANKLVIFLQQPKIQGLLAQYGYKNPKQLASYDTKQFNTELIKEPF